MFIKSGNHDYVGQIVAIFYFFKSIIFWEYTLKYQNLKKSKAILVFNNQSKMMHFSWDGVMDTEFLVFILRSDTSRQEPYFFSLSQTYFTILDTHKDLHFR